MDETSGEAAKGASSVHATSEILAGGSSSLERSNTEIAAAPPQINVKYPVALGLSFKDMSQAVQTLRCTFMSIL